MVTTVSSASAALTVLQTQAVQQEASGQREQDPVLRFLDPRSVLALAPQSFDALLKVRAELRRDRLQEQELAPRSTAAPNGTTTRPSNMLGTFKPSHLIPQVDIWLEDMARLKSHSTEPLNSSLMPWNSPNVIQQLKDWDVHYKNFEMRDDALSMDDAAIYKSMAETPAEDAAEIRSRGGTVWYEYGHLNDRVGDKEFYRNIKNYALYSETLRDPIDPSDKRAQAFLNGTAQIIRGSNIPELTYDFANYIYFAQNPEVGRYTQVGGWGRLKTNFDQVSDEIEKKNPTMNVSYIWADGDVAIILYPKTGSAAVTADAQSSTGTDIPPAVAPTH